MALKCWYKVVESWEDLREGRPLGNSGDTEFEFRGGP